MNDFTSEIVLKQNNKKQYKLINLMIKLAIGLGLCYLIYSHLNQRNGFEVLWVGFKEAINTSKIYLLILVFILLPLNWIFEAKKWMKLTSLFEPQNLTKSIQSVLCGITLAIITPNRIGEYGGRVLYLNPNNKGKGLIAQFISSFAQNMINISFGFLAMMIWYDQIYGLTFWFNIFLFSLWFLLTSLLLLIFFNLNVFSNWIHKRKWSKRWEKMITHISLFDQYNFKELSYLILLSLARFCVYSLQYVLILHFFGISEDPIIMVCGVATIFFVQSGVPLPPVLGILARGEIAIIIWSFFHYNELSILAATYSLWIINLMLPALIGLGLLFNTNILKSFGYGFHKME